MRKITALVDHELTWSQRSGLKSEYELRFGDDLVAAMRFPKMIGSAGVAECGEGTWTFERAGVLKLRTVVRASGTATELATFRASAWKRGGILELAEGRKLELRENFWKNRFELCTESEEELIQAVGRGFFRRFVDVRMSRKALQWPELPWLVLFLFYQMIMKQRDAAAHAALH